MKRELLDVLTMTAERTGYNKSVLLVGARGTGKTLVRSRGLCSPKLERGYSDCKVPLTGAGMGYCDCKVAFHRSWNGV